MAIQFTNNAVKLILDTMQEMGLGEDTVFALGLQENNITISFIREGTFSKNLNGLKIKTSPQLTQRYDVFIDQTLAPSIGLLFTQKKLF